MLEDLGVEGEGMWGEAGEDDFVEVGVGFEEVEGGLEGDVGGEVEWVAVDAGGDSWEGDGAEVMGGGEL